MRNAPSQNHQELLAAGRSLTLRREVRGAHHGQLDCTLRLVSGLGETVARLDFSVYEGTPHIQMITVLESRRRTGLATRLLAALQADHPDREIEWGMTTSDGEALRTALPVRHEPSEDAAHLARLERLRVRLDGLSGAMHARRAAGEDARSEHTAFYCLERHVDDLADRLRDARPTIAILDLDAPLPQAA